MTPQLSASYGPPGLLVALAAFVLAAPLGAAAAFVPSAPEFQVNAYTTGAQQQPGISVASDASFVVIWQSSAGDGPDQDGERIRVRAFDRFRNAVGSELDLNEVAADRQIDPILAPRAQGGGLALWKRRFGDSVQGLELRARLVSSSGAPLGGEVRLDQTQPVRVGTHAIAASQAADGSFLVVWDATGSTGISARRVSAGGAAIGSQFVVASGFPGIVGANGPSLARRSGADGFHLLWSWQPCIDLCGPGLIAGRSLASDGAKLGASFQVGSADTLGTYPVVAGRASGGSWAVWHDAILGLAGQQLDVDGARVGPAFLEPEVGGTGDLLQVLVELPEDELFMAWQSSETDLGDTSDTHIRARLRASDGTPLGAPLRINTVTQGFQRAPVVGLADDQLIVAWHSTTSPGTDSSSSSILARRLCLTPCEPVFADDFETGDISSWASSIP